MIVKRIAFVSSVLFSICSVFVALPAHAAMLDAVDMLGHPDADGNPVYTLLEENNIPNAASLQSPVDMVTDTVNHRLFVADNGNRRVLVYMLDTDNTFLDGTADYVLGKADFFTKTSGSSTSTNIDSVSGLAYDATNQRLFVVESGANRVLVFDVAIITNGEAAVNILGQIDFTTTTAGLSESSMSSPRGVSYDSGSGRLFVADRDNARVLIFDVTEIINNENAINVLGQEDFVTSSSLTTIDGMSSPESVVYDATNQRLFVAESFNRRVLVFDLTPIANGQDAINVLGQPNFGTSAINITQDGMIYPSGLSYDSTRQYLFVSDTYHNRVLIFDVVTIDDGENAINVLGQPDFITSDQATTQNGMSAPHNVEYNGTTNQLYVADEENHRVLIFDATAITDGENATGLFGQLDDDGNPVFDSKDNITSTGLDVDYGGFAMDTTNHRLFASDSDNSRILVFNLDVDNDLEDRIPDFVLGKTDFSHSLGSVTQSGMRSPVGLAYDSANDRLFASDRGSNRVLVFDTTTIVNGENAINVLGQVDFVSDASNFTQSSLSSPSGLLWDAINERLFVSDSGNNRVLIFDVTEIINGENAINVLGQPDFVTNASATTQSGMNGVFGLSLDTVTKNLFVADRGNNRVLVFDVDTIDIVNGQNAINVLGQPDFLTSASDITQNRMNSPRQLVWDAINERLFVADTSNNRILVFDLDIIIDGENAINVLGQPDFVTGTSGVTQQNFDNVTSILYDSTTNKLYIDDADNARIMILQLPRITTEALADAPVDTAYSQSVVATGGTTPYTFSLASGTLPAGLSLSSAGLVSGTPTETGDFTFSVLVEDDTVTSPETDHFSDTQEITLTVSTESVPPADDDVTAPVSVSESDLNNGVKMDSVNYFKKKTAKLSGKNSDSANGKMKLYKKTKGGGKTFVKEVSIDSDGSWSIRLPKNSDNFPQYYLKAEDASGNESDFSKVIKVIVDTEKPVFEKTLPSTLSILRNAHISFPATDDNGKVTYKIKLLDVRKKWRS